MTSLSAKSGAVDDHAPRPRTAVPVDPHVATTLNSCDGAGDTDFLPLLLLDPFHDQLLLIVLPGCTGWFVVVLSCNPTPQLCAV